MRFQRPFAGPSGGTRSSNHATINPPQRSINESLRVETTKKSLDDSLSPLLLGPTLKSIGNRPVLTKLGGKVFPTAGRTTNPEDSVDRLTMRRSRSTGFLRAFGWKKNSDCIRFLICQMVTRPLDSSLNTVSRNGLEVAIGSKSSNAN